jgi:outer membrane biosynthesis protein TonB
LDTKAIVRTRRVLTGGRWFLILGLVFYSLMTTTPFVSEHSTWSWSGWVLGLIVDVAFIMALSAEGTLAKYGVTKLGAWPVAFRWITGLSSVFLNVWLNVSAHDWVGVAVHLIAPALVMLLAEVGPVYMAALADAEREALSAPVSAPEPTADPTEPERLPEPEPVQEELPEPVADEEPEPVNDHGARLPNAEANKIIEQGWRHKLNPVEVAAAAGRHPATVRKKFAQLDAELTV